MSQLKKANIDKLYKKYIINSEELCIVEPDQDKTAIISKLLSFLSDRKFEHYLHFRLNNTNLENEIALCKTDYQSRKPTDNYFFPQSPQTQEEYIQEHMYSSMYNHVTTFLLEKYKPTQKDTNKSLLCEINFSRNARSCLVFAFYFNKLSQLTFDYIAVKGIRLNDSSISIDDDINILSNTTSLKAIKKLVSSFPEEDVLEYKEKEARKQRNAKNKVKKNKINNLSSSVVRSRIKTLLEEKNISFFISEKKLIFQLYLKMKKGKTMIRIPKKDILDRLDILPALCEKIIEADHLNIHCKYKQRL